MKRKNIFDSIRTSVSRFTKQISEVARDTIERVIPRRVSRSQETRPTETATQPIEDARKPRVLSAEGEELDVSTRASIQGLETELSGSRKAKDIAQQLGISVQKWVSIRKKIRAGDLYGDALLERLNETKTALDNSFEKFVEVKYAYTNPDGTHQEKTGEVVYFPSESRLQEKVPYGRRIKLFYTFSDAKNYWGQIGGGAEYFGIVNIGNGNYQVVDLRNQVEYNNRGKINGETRAQKILKNIERGRIQDEDE